MITLDGYEDLTQLHDGSNSQVYRAWQVNPGQSVILKVLKADYPTPQQIRRYQQEYHLAHRLTCPNVIKAFALKKWQRTLVIVFEDIGGIALKHWLQQYPQGVPIDLFLPLSLRITEAIGQLHEQAIIHKDINPANIVLNPETDLLKLIDLGLSTQLRQETPSLQSPNTLEGTLLYISPEQTGRMNRAVDYRTDFYSLGVTFYELLSGQLPFVSDNPMELVHCHIAKEPISLRDIPGKTIPQPLIEIVELLMAKNAEDRYQHALGLKADLENCHEQWVKTQQISHFAIGQVDYSSAFRLPQVLYGRGRETHILLSNFEQVCCGTANLLLVSGHSGIGKSALVNQIRQPILQQHGYFVQGKFDQFRRNVPYDAIIQAFQQLIQQLLSESSEQLDQWRYNLTAQLGKNAQVIIDVIPDLALIMGPQPAVSVLSPTDAQVRFNQVFQKFVSVFTQQDHPLVLFLDDLQWVDLASLDLIQQIMINPEAHHLFLIGAYRKNEVTAAHPLMLTLEQLRQQQITVNQVILDPLSLEDVQQLVADTLHTPLDQALPLSALIFSKTLGNAFFSRMLLTSLYHTNQLVFDFSQGRWQWDIEALRQISLTDNVVELMSQRIDQLPKPTQEILTLAACMGDRFDLATLSVVSELSPIQAAMQLWPACEAGLILPLDNAYKISVVLNKDADPIVLEPADAVKVTYRFGHDRIQQAAYELVSDSAQQQTHLQIARLMLQQVHQFLGCSTDVAASCDRLLENDPGEVVFEIANHFNRATCCITERAEQYQIAALNWLAGQRAKNATAYSSARNYFVCGLEMLPDEAWQVHYGLAFALHRDASECTYLCGRFEEAEQLFEETLAHARSVVDQVAIHNIRLVLYDNQGKFAENLRLGGEALRSLGFEWPQAAAETPAILDKELAIYRQQLTQIQIEQLTELPEMTSLEAQAAMQLLINMTGPAYFTDPTLVTLITLKMTNLSMQYGSSEWASQGYTFWGVMLVATFREYESAYAFGTVGLALKERYNNRYEVKVLTCFAGSISPWRDHLKKSIDLLRQGYRVGSAVGDIYACYIASHLGAQLLTVGTPLEEISSELLPCLGYIRQRKSEIFVRQLQVHLYWGASLQAGMLSIESSGLEDFSHQVAQALFEQHQYGPGLFSLYFTEAFVYFFSEQYSQAQAMLLAAEPYLPFVGSMPLEAEYFMLLGLTTAALADPADGQLQPQTEATLALCAEKLNQWSAHCEANYRHKALLIAAEQSRLTGDKLATLELYDQAISAAQKAEFIQYEALANERAARFWLTLQKPHLARVYLETAYYGYQRWGAVGKIQQLEQNYSELLSTKPLNATGSTLEVTTVSVSSSSSSSQGSTLDLATLLKTSQTIASEIVLDNLLRSLMNILLENAGAQTGCLLLPTLATSGGEGDLLLAIDNDGYPTSIALTELDTQTLPHSIINYVARTYDSVVLDDARKSSQFAQDPYIRTKQPLSVLCYPLLNQGELAGIVYLENKITTAAFTQHHIQFLQLLSGQAAIAITNAQLYARVRGNEQQLQQFLEAVPVGIGILDQQGHPFYANQRAQELLGQGTQPEASASEIAEVYRNYIAGTDQPYPNQDLPIVRALQGEASYADDLEIHYGEQIIPLEAWGTPIYNEAGEVLYAISAFQDISQRKRAEQILADYSQELEQAVHQRTLELAEANQQLQAEIQERQRAEQQLQIANQELQRIATIDGLTQVANRRYFDQLLQQEWNRLLREQQLLSLILFDVDYFKRYNDHYGHQAGDDCLVQVAQAARQATNRTADLVARYGGEEFVVVLPHTDQKGGIAVAKRIRQNLRQQAIPHAASDVSTVVSVSLGIATLAPSSDSSPEQLIEMADRALYAAKQQGRDRYSCYTEPKQNTTALMNYD